MILQLFVCHDILLTSAYVTCIYFAESLSLDSRGLVCIYVVFLPFYGKEPIVWSLIDGQIIAGSYMVDGLCTLQYSWCHVVSILMWLMNMWDLWLLVANCLYEVLILLSMLCPPWVLIAYMHTMIWWKCRIFIQHVYNELSICSSMMSLYDILVTDCHLCVLISVRGCYAINLIPFEHQYRIGRGQLKSRIMRKGRLHGRLSYKVELE